MIVGYGSAALHWIRALETLGISIGVVASDPFVFTKLTDRYTQRYGADLPHAVVPVDMADRMNSFEVAIIATPPLVHEQNVNVVKHRSSAGTKSVIFVEKPMMVNEPGETSIILSDSHFNWTDSWRAWLRKVAERSRQDFVVSAQGNFIEDLEGSSKAHPWNPRYVQEWVSQASKGGGPLLEFSHPLYWVANLFQILGMGLPSPEFVEMKPPRSARQEGAQYVELNGTNEGVTWSVVQAMSFESVSTEKSVVVRFRSGRSERFNFNTLDPIAATHGSRRNLYRELSRARKLITSLEDVRVRALWVDQIIETFREG